MKTLAILADELEALTAGLLFMSETDYPWTVVQWAGTEAPTPESVRAWAGLPPQAPFAVDEASRLWQAPTTEQPASTAEVRQRVRRYHGLVAWLEKNLSEQTVMRYGGVRQDVYVFGRTAAGEWLGLHTQAVET